VHWNLPRAVARIQPDSSRSGINVPIRSATQYWFSFTSSRVSSKRLTERSGLACTSRITHISVTASLQSAADGMKWYSSPILEECSGWDAAEIFQGRHEIFKEEMKIFKVGVKIFKVGRENFQGGVKIFKVGRENFQGGVRIFKVGVKIFKAGVKIFKVCVKIFKVCVKIFKVCVKIFKVGVKIFKVGVKIFKVGVKILKVGMKNFRDVGAGCWGERSQDIGKRMLER
jgi:hypothetical protein